MPINSFDDYPMSWKPDKARLSRPYYLALADQMAKDISSGALLPGTKLPPQRELADFLDLNLSTVTKAYKLCEKRGMMHAVTGKGSFVAPYAAVEASIIEHDRAPGIVLSTTKPFYEQNALIRDIALQILKRPHSEDLFNYEDPLGTPEQAAAGVQWLASLGMPSDVPHTLIASGVQSALAGIMTSLFEPGSKIAVNSYSYPNFIELARHLHIQLIPVESDESGMRADRLDSLCTLQKIHGLYLMPAGSNPENERISPARKRELADVIRRHDLILLEDDNYAAILPEKPEPMSVLLPENALYLSGLSKPVCAGLRIAFLSVPDRYLKTLRTGLINQNLKISSLNIEIAAQLIFQGYTSRITTEKRELSRRRNNIYHQFFPDAPCDPYAYCQWLPIPRVRTGRETERCLRGLGVAVFAAERFAVSGDLDSHFLRIATCSPENTAQLADGLRILKGFLQDEEKGRE